MRVFFRSSTWLFLWAGFFHISGCFGNPQPSIQFIENKNQWEKGVDFSANIPGGTMRIGPGSFRYYFIDGAKLDALHNDGHHGHPDASTADDQIRAHSVHVNFVGADLHSTPLAFGKSKQYYNYYLGTDPRRWASDVFAFDGMLYPSLYDKIDLKLYASGQNLKYDFIVGPYGDPSQISITYEGAEEVFLDNGNLYIRTPLAEIVERRPVAYQYIGGRKIPVKCEYALRGTFMSFTFPEGYDSCHELVIDPLLIFSTFSGSTADNWGSTATPGESGNLYSAGVTNQSGGGIFPATAGAYQVTSGGVYDIGILKYDSTGSELLYATYFGGSDSESPHSLIVNAAGELVLLGTTTSGNFPTTPAAFDRSFNGGATDTQHVISYSNGSDIIIGRFSRDGRNLLSSTYVGGSANDGLNYSGGPLTKNYGDQLRGDVITDAVGNVYVSSVTASNDFPAANGFESEFQGGDTDAILFKMNPDLSQMTWGSFMGGSGTDAAHTLKLDKSSNVYFAGGTTSNDLPVTIGSFQINNKGDADGWIAKISANGLSILNSTYTGTEHYNQIYFLDLNSDEEVYVYGQTSGVFPITTGVYSNPNSGQFIQKFNNTLSGRIFSTVFGAGRGIPDISPTAFIVNECNNLYMAGWGGIINSNNNFWNSRTTGMVTTPDAYQRTTSGSDFYFMVMTDDASEMLYATFLGGTQSRTHVDGGTSRFDKHGIVYHSVCAGCAALNASQKSTSDFPTTPGAWSNTNRSQNCNNAAFKFDLSSLKARIQTNSVFRDLPGMNVVCIPDPILFQNPSTGGEIFEWNFGDGTNISTTDTLAIVHHYKMPGKYLVKLKAIDRGTCLGKDSVYATITVDLPEGVFPDDADICFGDSHELKASGAVLYLWTSPDDDFISYEAAPVVTPKDTTTYYIRITELKGCVRRDTVQINVVPGINPDFEWDKQPECEGRPEIAVRNLTDSLKAGDRVFFDYGDGTASDRVEEEHYFEEDGVYNVRLIAQREFCVYEKAVAIPVFEMLIPNVITPGNPEFNDVFTIRYGKANGVTPAHYGFNVALTIYNRWGDAVYQTDNYQYDWSGADVAAGVYYYEVTVQGHASCKSWLQVVK